MRDNDPIRQIIKYRNKKIRESVLKLPHLRWLSIIHLVAAGLLTISYFTYEEMPWFSGALVSASCGCFTGLIFYFLVNIRNNREKKIRQEYLSLKKTDDILKCISNYGEYYKLYKQLRWEKRDAFEAGGEIILLLDALEVARNQIKLEIYDIVDSLGYDPLDRDNMNSYRTRLKTASDVKSMEESILYVWQEVSPVRDEFQKLMQERADQMNFMDEYFL